MMQDGGVPQHFPGDLLPASPCACEGLHKLAGCYPMVTRSGELYFCNVTPALNTDLSAEDLAKVRTEARGFFELCCECHAISSPALQRFTCESCARLHKKADLNS